MTGDTPRSRSDCDYLREVQYGTPVNLEARVELHRRYTPQGADIWPFLWERYPFEPNSELLEIGCGAGLMWRQDCALVLPEGLRRTLTDVSPGMLSAAREQLGAAAEFLAADAEKLPFGAGAFDAVLAQFMLYHCLSPERALSEIRRVLKPSGWAGIVLNGRSHLARIFSLAQEICPGIELAGGSAALDFSAEDAEELLPKFFPQVTVHRYSCRLEVDNAAVLVAYARSCAGYQQSDLPDDFWERYEARISSEIAECGCFELHKDSRLYICRPIE